MTEEREVLSLNATGGAVVDAACCLTV